MNKTPGRFVPTSVTRRFPVAGDCDAPDDIASGSWEIQILRHLIASDDLCIAMLQGADLRYTFVNAAYQAIAPAVAMVGRTLREVFPEAAASGAERRFRDVLQTGKPWEVTAYRAPVPGKPDATWQGRVVRLDEAGKEPSVLALFWDVTDRARMEAALQESERRTAARAAELQTVLDTVPAAVWIARDPQGTTIEANRYGAGMLRRPPGVNVSVTAPPTERPTNFRPMKDGVELRGDELPIQAAAQQGIDIRDYEFDLLFDDGAVCHLLGNASPIIGKDGRPIGSVGAFIDITGRKRADGALRRSEARMRAVFDALVEGVVFLDPDGVVVDANDAVQRIHGHGMNELTDPALDPRSRIVRADRTPFPVEEQPAIVALRTGQAVRDVEMGVPTAHGGFRWRVVNAQPIHDASGNILGVVASFFDITERKKAEEALREADRRKDEFLATLAHELRNPLAAIRNASEILKRNVVPDPSAGRAVDMIDRQLQQMIRLIDDLLDVTRITTGKLELRKTRTTLQDIVGHAVDEARAIAGNQARAITVDAPAEPLFLECDGARLRQVLANLLDNARKFTGAHGRIEVHAARDGDHALVIVADDGVGIASEYLGSVFDMFSQVRSGTQTMQHGLGIGLSLTRKLVELHGGTIEARSAGIGHGSEFAVRLPLEREAAQPAAASSDKGNTQNMRKLRILVVDDNRDAAESLQMLLEIAGHEALVAGDGYEALRTGGTFAPHVIVLDIGMPGMDGYETCRAIRAEPWGKGITIVALSGWGQEADRESSRAAGFDGHLVKPAGPDELMLLLASLGARI